MCVSTYDFESPSSDEVIAGSDAKLCVEASVSICCSTVDYGALVSRVMYTSDETMFVDGSATSYCGWASYDGIVVIVVVFYGDSICVPSDSMGAVVRL